MIPKVIHYCWFGGEPLTDDAKYYIDTWRKCCPDYEIIEWNESNFDINENIYCREAYEAKKWAFVSDYVRLKVLYEYGGIYMDTDVEVCKNLDLLLGYDAVVGYETTTSISTCTIAACRGNEWIGVLLHDYTGRHFYMEDGNLDLTTNVTVITKLTKNIYGVELDGKKKIFGNNICLFPFDYLCAKSFETGEVSITNNTFTVHHYAGSWLDKNEKCIHLEYQKAKRKLKWIPWDIIASKMAMTIAVFRMNGFLGVTKRIAEKMRT